MVSDRLIGVVPSELFVVYDALLDQLEIMGHGLDRGDTVDTGPVRLPDGSVTEATVEFLAPREPDFTSRFDEDHAAAELGRLTALRVPLPFGPRAAAEHVRLRELLGPSVLDVVLAAVRDRQSVDTIVDLTPGERAALRPAWQAEHRAVLGLATAPETAPSWVQALSAALTSSVAALLAPRQRGAPSYLAREDSRVFRVRDEQEMRGVGLEAYGTVARAHDAEEGVRISLAAGAGEPPRVLVGWAGDEESFREAVVEPTPTGPRLVVVLPAPPTADAEVTVVVR